MSNTIINTNVMALNSHRSLTKVGLRQARSAERLSSGMRINRAADDAAGLSISEKMRAQIRGLDQAERNSQDGISLTQVAEGALQEMHNVIQRVRELTVQASNDTLDENDRIAIQLELTSLMDELEGVIDRTEFNGIPLLDADVDFQPSTLIFDTMVDNVVVERITPETAQATMEFWQSIMPEDAWNNWVRTQIQGSMQSGGSLNANSTIEEVWAEVWSNRPNAWALIDSGDPDNEPPIPPDFESLTAVDSLINAATEAAANAAGLAAREAAISAAMEAARQEVMDAMRDHVIDRWDDLGQGIAIEGVLYSLIYEIETKIDDLKSQLDALLAQRDTLNNNITNAENRIDLITGTLLPTAESDLQNAINDLTDAEAILAQSEIALQDAITAVNDAQNRVDAAQDNITTITDLQSENNTAILLAQGIFDLAQTAFDERSAERADLEARLAADPDNPELQAELDALIPNYNAARDLRDGAQGDLDNLHEERDQLGLQLADAHNELADAHNELNGAITARDVAQTARNNALTNRNAAQAEVTRLQDLITSLNQELINLPISIGNWQSQLTQINDRIPPLEGQIESLKDVLDRIRDITPADFYDLRDIWAGLMPGIEAQVLLDAIAAAGRAAANSQQAQDDANAAATAPPTLADANAAANAAAQSAETLIAAMEAEAAARAAALESYNEDFRLQWSEWQVDWANRITALPNDIYIQNGANSNENLILTLPNLNTSAVPPGPLVNLINKLQDEDFTMGTHLEITQRLNDIDAALQEISTYRADLGATQNRLEHTINNLQIGSENTTAAESRIRDTDMAREMMQQTQANVLQQAAVSMLAQANQAPQAILQLLQ